MKNSKLLLIALAAAFALAGCSKSSEGNPDDDNGTGTVVGQWHLVSWSSLTAADIYLSFDDTGSFALYQRVYTPQYVHLDGTYTLDGSSLSGTYSDNTPWGNSYRVSFNSDGTRMTLTSTASADDVSVFVKAEIPSEIVSGQLDASALQSVPSSSTPRFL